jgi:hypothetical protein
VSMSNEVRDDWSNQANITFTPVINIQSGYKDNATNKGGEDTDNNMPLLS